MQPPVALNDSNGTTCMGDKGIYYHFPGKKKGIKIIAGLPGGDRKPAGINVIRSLFKRDYVQPPLRLQPCYYGEREHCLTAPASFSCNNQSWVSVHNHLL